MNARKGVYLGVIKRMEERLQECLKSEAQIEELFSKGKMGEIQRSTLLEQVKHKKEFAGGEIVKANEALRKIELQQPKEAP